MSIRHAAIITRVDAISHKLAELASNSASNFAQFIKSRFERFAGRGGGEVVRLLHMGRISDARGRGLIYDSDDGRLMPGEGWDARRELSRRDVNETSDGASSYWNDGMPGF